MYFSSIIICMTSYLVMTASSQPCSKGEYLHTGRDGIDVCLPCENHTFMPVDDHTYRACYKCTRVQASDLEDNISECNRTHDSVIICVPGYYRKIQGGGIDNGTCVQCDSCSYTGRHCQNFSNAVCCPGKNYDVIGDVCIKQPVECGPGQYFNKSMPEDQEQCLPCPDGSFNPLHKHNTTNCLQCREPDPSHGMVTKVPCNKTHDTVMGCKVGYFLEQHDKSVYCTNCRNCSVDNMFAARNCTETSDTVCCPEPDMEVTDTHQCKKTLPPVVQGNLTTCGEGQYLHFNTNNQESSCPPCMIGTFQDIVNHTESECQNCTEFKGAHIPQTCQEPGNNNNTDAGNNNTVLYIVLAVCAVFVFAVIFIIVVLYKRRRRQGQICHQGDLEQERADKSGPEDYPLMLQHTNKDDNDKSEIEDYPLFPKQTNKDDNVKRC